MGQFYVFIALFHMDELCLSGLRRASFFFCWISRWARLLLLETGQIEFFGCLLCMGQLNFFPFFGLSSHANQLFLQTTGSWKHNKKYIFKEIKKLSPEATLGKYIIKAFIFRIKRPHPPVCLKMQKYIFPMSWNYWFLSLNSRLGMIMNLMEILPI